MSDTESTTASTPEPAKSPWPVIPPPPPPRFCPQCATALATRSIEGRSRLACPDPTCEWVFWDNPVPVVAAVLEHEGAVILARNVLWPEGRFGLITGFLERGESPQEGIVREVREETGLQGEVVALIGTYPFHLKNQIVIAFHVIGRGTVALGDELADYRRIPPERLQPWPSATGEAVRDWLAQRTSNAAAGPASPLNLGCHLSIAKGLPAMYDQALQVGATCAQIFTRNPRGGARRSIDDAELAQAATRRAAAGVKTVIAHIPYTVNPASPRQNALDFARMVLREDLRHADRLDAQFVVFHPGSHVDSGVQAGTRRIVETIRHALDDYDGQAMLLLEGMSGGGSEIGGSPEELRAILDGLDGDPRVGVCLDSCHLFAAGWDLRTRDGIDRCLRAFDQAVGLDRIRCLHLNDCKSPLGSHKDRHAKIGQGELGEEGIRQVVTHPFFATLPLCLETPVDDWPEYEAEIAAVRRLAEPS